MTRKLAIFCEGQTELIFLSKFLAEYACASSFSMQAERFTGRRGTSHRRREVTFNRLATSSDRFILLVDSGKDSSVLSDMVDQGPSLLRNGYWGLLGLRDLAPLNTIANVSSARIAASAALTNLNKSGLKSAMLIAIQEIETWFLAEHTHYLKIDGKLNLATVNKVLGYDCSTGDLSTVARPSSELNRIYKHVKHGYSKRGKTVQKTVDALCCCNICFGVSNRIREIQSLMAILDSFFS